MAAPNPHTGSFQLNVDTLSYSVQPASTGVVHPSVDTFIDGLYRTNDFGGDYGSSRFALDVQTQLLFLAPERNYYDSLTWAHDQDADSWTTQPDPVIQLVTAPKDKGILGASYVASSGGSVKTGSNIVADTPFYLDLLAYALPYGFNVEEEGGDDYVQVIWGGPGMTAYNDTAGATAAGALPYRLTLYGPNGRRDTIEQWDPAYGRWQLMAEGKIAPLDGADDGAFYYSLIFVPLPPNGFLVQSTVAGEESFIQVGETLWYDESSSTTSVMTKELAEWMYDNSITSYNIFGSALAFVASAPDNERALMVSASYAKFTGSQVLYYRNLLKSDTTYDATITYAANRRAPLDSEQTELLPWMTPNGSAINFPDTPALYYLEDYDDDDPSNDAYLAADESNAPTHLAYSVQLTPSTDFRNTPFIHHVTVFIEGEVEIAPFATNTDLKDYFTGGKVIVDYNDPNYQFTLNYIVTGSVEDSTPIEEVYSSIGDPLPDVPISFKFRAGSQYYELFAGLSGTTPTRDVLGASICAEGEGLLDALVHNGTSYWKLLEDCPLGNDVIFDQSRPHEVVAYLYKRAGIPEAYHDIEEDSDSVILPGNQYAKDFNWEPAYGTTAASFLTGQFRDVHGFEPGFRGKVAYYKAPPHHGPETVPGFVEEAHGLFYERSKTKWDNDGSWSNDWLPIFDSSPYTIETAADQHANEVAITGYDKNTGKEVFVIWEDRDSKRDRAYRWYRGRKKVNTVKFGSIFGNHADVLNTMFILAKRHQPFREFRKVASVFSPRFWVSRCDNHATFDLPPAYCVTRIATGSSDNYPWYRIRSMEVDLGRTYAERVGGEIMRVFMCNYVLERMYTYYPPVEPLTDYLANPPA